MPLLVDRSAAAGGRQTRGHNTLLPSSIIKYKISRAALITIGRGVVVALRVGAEVLQAIDTFIYIDNDRKQVTDNY